MRRLFSDAHYDFIGLRRIAYMASGAALIISLLAGLAWELTRGSWLNYGVDFAGGTLVQVRFVDPVAISDETLGHEAVHHAASVIMPRGLGCAQPGSL
jgi:preprotein translocase subunit SecF